MLIFDGAWFDRSIETTKKTNSRKIMLEVTSYGLTGYTQWW
jgi:hypothetical protein